METFPVRLDEAAGVIAVDFSASNLAAAGLATSASLPTTTGGAATSAERNNVYGIEPRVYLQDGSEIDDRTGKPKIEPATLVLGTVAVAIVAVAVRLLVSLFECWCACVSVRSCEYPMPMVGHGGGHQQGEHPRPGGVLVRPRTRRHGLFTSFAVALTRVLRLPCSRLRIALLVPVGVFVFKNAEEGEGPK